MELIYRKLLKLTTFYLPLNTAAGKSYWLWVIIDPKYKNDIGLHEHEYLHCKQGWRLPFIHGIWYFLSRSYRLECEVECYRHQLTFYPQYRQEELRNKFAAFLVLKYNLAITHEYALKRLEE